VTAHAPARRPGRLPPLAIALGVFALHMALSTRYGYFRDELYYIAAARHPALGYFDFPTGVAMVAWLVGHTFGYRLWALHLPPALAHAGLVLVAAGIAADMGAGTFGTALAALAAAVAPAYLGSGSILTMDVFDELCWALAGWAALRALQRDRPHAWLWFGAAAALGLLFKMTMLLFGAAVLAALLLTATGRRHLGTRWPWLGGAIAALGLLPYVAWEMAHGWPTLAFYAAYRAARAASGQSVGAFVEQQVLLGSVLSAPIWVAGLWCSLVAPAGRRVRALGVAYALLFAFLAAVRAKVYFLDPMFTLLFGLGAPRVEAWLAGRRWLAATYPALVVAGGTALAPIVMPLLPPPATAAYSAPLHVGEYTAAGDNPIIQPLADRFGWPQLVAASNYGEAAALGFFGPAYGLPAAISGHNQYYLWGPGNCDFAVVVSVGLQAGTLARLFASVQPEAAVRCQYCVPEENGAPIDVDRQPRLPPAAMWAALRSVS
jgi:4-amino-4-deoxy-L-arabinose transferase-like glycosyltransferase